MAHPTCKGICTWAPGPSHRQLLPLFPRSVCTSFPLARGIEPKMWPPAGLSGISVLPGGASWENGDKERPEVWPPPNPLGCCNSGCNSIRAKALLFFLRCLTRDSAEQGRVGPDQLGLHPECSPGAMCNSVVLLDPSIGQSPIIVDFAF